MHETVLIQRVLETIFERLKKEKPGAAKSVKEVHLKVGALSLHGEDSFRQNFEILTKGTTLEDSKLKLTVLAPKLKCAHCSYEGPCQGDFDPHDPTPFAECPSCKTVCLLHGGGGVEAIELTFLDG
ncbi:MAG: hydrogenase maturation nickel metallochaperone HypA [Elusimicrobia bacterium]|nr:hydrogenase maturation nickel metallochaperone HypA [Elusimicrobiota bacterium]